MNWIAGKYHNMEQSGDYSITGHRDFKTNDPFFIAYWKQHIIAGSCPTADEARAVCAAHAEKRN